MMYYEESEINGVIHYRTNPSGEWIVKQMTTPIEKVQAALDAAQTALMDKCCGACTVGCDMDKPYIKEALSELKGKVLVPVEQTWQPMNTAPRDGTEILVLQTSGCVQRVKFITDDADDFEGWVDFQDEGDDWDEQYFIGWMIAPYVKGE